jgi:hypothetical protein
MKINLKIFLKKPCRRLKYKLSASRDAVPLISHKASPAFVESFIMEMYSPYFVFQFPHEGEKGGVERRGKKSCVVVKAYRAHSFRSLNLFFPRSAIAHFSYTF